MAVADFFCNSTGLFQGCWVCWPIKISPCHLADGSVEIARLTSVKVRTSKVRSFSVIENLPTKGAQIARVPLLKVDVDELLARVRDEDVLEGAVYVLEVGPGEELRGGGREPTGHGARDVELSTEPAVRVDAGTEEGELLTKVSHCEDEGADWSGPVVRGQALKGVGIHRW